MKKAMLMFAMLLCFFTSCSEDVEPELIIDSDIVSNGLFFDETEREQTITFSVNTDWTLSITPADNGITWCKASVTNGDKGTNNVKFEVTENTDYDPRSVLVTIKADWIEQSFIITQKGTDALLITTDKYEISQEGGKIEIEVKTNIDYQVEISETAKSWITETYSRALITRKHVFDVSMNTRTEERKGEIIFRNGDKVEKVKVSQEGVTVVSVTLEEAGTLKSAMGDDYLNISSLKIIGPINGDDVYYLRKMLGGNEFKDESQGKLVVLDMSEALIVEGGRWYYYDTFLGRYCYTNNNEIGYCMFEYCSNLKEFILPNNIISIGMSGFAGCKNLTSITIVDSVESIGQWAFSGCEYLNFIRIGAGVKYIGLGAFSLIDSTSIHITDLSAWCNISYRDNQTFGGWKLYLNDKELTELIVPKDITIVNDFVFQAFKNIVKIIIHDNITEIGQDAFYAAPITECYSYASIPPDIGKDAFYSVKSDAILYVPKGCGDAYKGSIWGRYFNKIVEIK